VESNVEGMAEEFDNSIVHLIRAVVVLVKLKKHAPGFINSVS
jgi:hypothetical protein